ncbi:MAG: NADPH-dependent glutamate synthase [Bacillota bacterium]
MAKVIEKRNTPREQEPLVRAKNFKEVNIGFDLETAIKEANRCLGCKNAKCKAGCPVGIDIPAFIARVKVGDIDGAYKIIKQSNSLPAVCGRVCPQESQCECGCILTKMGHEPVAIGALEKFVADHASKNMAPEAIVKNGKRVAIVGSGPAGLSCAADCAKAGYEVTIFEAFHEVGGVLVYGIPEFRLPKSIVKDEVEALMALGVIIKKNTVIGKTFTIADLKTEYDAIFIGSGAGLPVFMGIKGENLAGVYSANEYLTRVNLMKAYKPDSPTPIQRGTKVAVVGAGNVAMDAARTALRMGAESVKVVYRRSRKEMPARAEEIHHAEQEGIEFLLLNDAVEILGDTKVTGMKVRKMQLGEPDARGRARPVPIPDSEYDIDVDQVIMSIGTSPNPLLPKSDASLEVSKWGTIVADEYGQTSIPGVFAGGDAVIGAATVILAMSAGRKAAAKIIETI